MILSFDSSNLEYFIHENILSGRYKDNSNIFLMINSLNLGVKEIILGFNPLSLGWEGKGIGDSGFLLKLLTGGFLYLLAYYYLIYCLIKKYFFISLYLRKELLPIFIFLLLVESGTTAFSLPQVSVIIYTFILIFTLIPKNEKNSVNSKCNSKI
jgi:hypothetical protein